MAQSTRFPQVLSTPTGEVTIVPADAGQIPQILALFDESVAWLNAKGITGQWGTTPFSQLPAMRGRLEGWIEQGALFVAYVGEELAGVLAVGEQPPAYARASLEGRPGSFRYLEAFTTSRRYEGRGIGGALLRWADAYSRERGAEYMRLDCWGDNPALVSYYQRNGYTPLGEFMVGTWRGQLFEKRLA